MRKTYKLLASTRDLFLFWLHAGLMTWYLVSGFFYSLKTVVIALLLIQLHLVIFGGCIITQLQHRLGAVPKNEEFIPYFFRRVFRMKLEGPMADLVFYLLLAFPLIIGVLR